MASIWSNFAEQEKVRSRSLAEVIAGEIGRALGLNVPELVFVEVDSALGRNEPDEEIRDLLRASAGLNLGLDYLPSSAMFDLAAGDTASPELASRAVWFDSFVTNVDRTARNPNLLCWHKLLYFIDHGAALYFHHNWPSLDQVAVSRFAAVRQHTLLPWASCIAAVDAVLRPLLTQELLANLVGYVPDEWLLPGGSLDNPADCRRRYSYLERRLDAASNFVEEAVHTHAELF